MKQCECILVLKGICIFKTISKYLIPFLYHLFSGKFPRTMIVDVVLDIYVIYRTEMLAEHYSESLKFLDCSRII